MRDIDTSCPADLQPYADAYNLDKKQRDNEMWMWFGTYGLSAVSVAVEHCLAGRKAKSKYIKKPINEQQGKCFSGDPEYFYRSKIVAWKKYNAEREE